LFVRLLLTPLLFNRVMSQFEAARIGDLQQLRVALTAGNVNDVDVYGRTALHWAAEWIC
jgi:ankyrin repeat protein